jgi:hypothetical protein
MSMYSFPSFIHIHCVKPIFHSREMLPYAAKIPSLGEFEAVVVYLAENVLQTSREGIWAHV